MSRNNARKRDRRKARQLRERRRKARASVRKDNLKEEKIREEGARPWARRLVAEYDALYPGWFRNVVDGGNDSRMTIEEEMTGRAAAQVLGLEWLEGETSDPNFVIRSDKWEETIARPEVAAARAAYRAELGMCDGCLESCEDLNPGGKCEPYYRTQGTPEAFTRKELEKLP